MSKDLEKIFSDLLGFGCKFFICYGDKGSEKYFFVDGFSDGKFYGKPVNYEGKNFIILNDLSNESLKYSLWVNLNGEKNEK